MLENENAVIETQEETTKEPKDDATVIEEIEIEEMAIDGICGVY